MNLRFALIWFLVCFLWFCSKSSQSPHKHTIKTYLVDAFIIGMQNYGDFKPSGHCVNVSHNSPVDRWRHAVVIHWHRHKVGEGLDENCVTVPIKQYQRTPDQSSIHVQCRRAPSGTDTGSATRKHFNIDRRAPQNINMQPVSETVKIRGGIGLQQPIYISFAPIMINRSLTKWLSDPY